ncbi:membrane-bound acyltransferase YfiQ involved in biofilm formation [Mucilaginibacter gracilis]|uniref:Membrane-bound acyltransferase YfiQ involved in biofilm formation n=2 Tax=Mucilaginibacter gracilis TaxID=423350 RepID=A0A495IYX3_9SPHI|nr:membrane-bound acyltransferase YfiQ involved in biofilm formation [Mucilaginibacter gracilis]
MGQSKFRPPVIANSGAVEGAGVKKNYLVIDTIRFIAMCSIVWGHCNLGCEQRVFHNIDDIFIQSVILQLGKIGTIIFFLISGFLMESKIDSYTPLSFLKLRLRSTIIPWFVVVLLFGLLNLSNDASLKTALAQHHYKEALNINFIILRTAIFYFAYWFIIVYLISAVLLIALKKHLNKAWLGLSLALITAFYCVNLHYGWVSAYHTKAFLGYAFFMWLGIIISKNYTRFIAFLENTSWGYFILAFAISFIFACREGINLSKIGCADPYASIRITNIFNSLLAFACLFKLGKINLINKLDPRKTVYGIYLLHNMVIYGITELYHSFFSNYNINPSISNLLVAEIIAFIFVLSVTYLITILLLGKRRQLVIT